MSQDPPAIPWIHIGECPVCVNGLCRVRCCEGGQGGKHLYAMCDECEAIWLEPTTDAEKQYPDAEQPHCPICGQQLYGPHARWAKSEDLIGTDWNETVIFDLPSAGAAESLPESSATEQFVTPDDIADSLDAPPQITSRDANPRPTVDNIADQASDAAYGEDEPKPGC